MKAAGVAVTWPTCPCLSRVRSDELAVRIASAFPTAEPESLGFSLLDVKQQTGTLATVFADREAPRRAPREDYGANLNGPAHSKGHRREEGRRTL